MAAKSGKLGKIEYAGAKVLNINQWTVDIDTNMLDVTAWSTGTDQWRSFAAGLSGAAASVSGFWDADGSTGQKNLQTNVLTPSTGTLILYINKAGGENLRGTVLMERMGVDVALDGTADVAFDCRFTGAVTYSTAT